MSVWKSTSKIAAAVLVAAFLILSSPGLAGASWLIDPTQYHISAHGQFLCLDCHAELENKKHPDPSLVKEKLTKFFSADKCFSCHPEVRQDLETKKHQRLKIKRPDRFNQCITCHNPHYRILKNNPLKPEDIKGPDNPVSQLSGIFYENWIAMPYLYPEDWACLSCHLEPLPGDPLIKTRIATFCQMCHGQAADIRGKFPKVVIPQMGLTELEKSKHQSLTCLECHSTSPRFNHSNRKPEDCLSCHDQHGDENSGDVHLRVSCEACHVKGMEVLKDEKTGIVGAVLPKDKSKPSLAHGLIKAADEEACRECHNDENKLGTAAMALPSKSIICMPCHEGSPVESDTVTILSVLVFLAGIIIMISGWMAAIPRVGSKTPPLERLPSFFKSLAKGFFSGRTLVVIKAIFLDALLNRKLYEISPQRWAIHSLVFLSMVFRFSWGVFASLASNVAPKSSLVWLMLDRDYALTAFLFDLTGALIILGVCLAMYRRSRRFGKQVTGLPAADWPSFILFGMIIIIGFLLEGMRMAMGGLPEPSWWAFIGKPISLIMSGAGSLTVIYGYLWYAHAIAVGAFIALLPFGRMMHLIMAPISLVINAVIEYDHKQHQQIGRTKWK